eukprot:232905-Pleurochrysis_carterae.AAC.2
MESLLGGNLILETFISHGDLWQATGAGAARAWEKLVATNAPPQEKSAKAAPTSAESNQVRDGEACVAIGGCGHVCADTFVCSARPMRLRDACVEYRTKLKRHRSRLQPEPSRGSLLRAASDESRKQSQFMTLGCRDFRFQRVPWRLHYWC